MRLREGRKGAVVSSEILFLLAVLVIGSLAGMYALQSALNTGLNNMADTIKRVSTPPASPLVPPAPVWKGKPCQ